MSNQSFIRIETLTKDNFDTWKLQVEALLIKNDTWEYVSGVRQRPEEINETTIAAAAAWDAADRKARSD